ncbi:G-PATCH DOMAIN CONTAINING PROTEIN [Salix viminalis]|uniref:G-PATCH DOMAIN CONTAINING PROTEIN n=1 Tax=Salix viminalis TaxID=40686 RepID=A0A9Q0V6V3_SALVM|nr:G-PATCH DOMAIN CONTAINING PROTEIN [Salix viminalis]
MPQAHRNFGAFEVHTKGFGSKMMGKMGFIQGGGLGKDGQGMAQPIEVIQRPKSLGLGVDFSNISGDSVKNKPQSIGTELELELESPENIVKLKPSELSKSTLKDLDPR